MIYLVTIITIIFTKRRNLLEIYLNTQWMFIRITYTLSKIDDLSLL